jgi:tetratricopeptide (TPR) repeat protein
MHLALPLALTILLQADVGPSPVEAGVRAYQSGKFVKACELLAQAVDAQSDRATRARALSYLAASWLGRGNAQEAKRTLVRLLQENPSNQLDPGEFVPELIQLELRVREELAKAPPAKPVEAPKPEVVVPAPPKPEPSPVIVQPTKVAAEATADPGRTHRIAGFSLIGVGAALVAAGAVTGIVELKQFNDAQATTPKDEEWVLSQRSKFRTMSWAADAMYVAGAAAAGVGLVLVLTAPSSPEKPRVSLAPRIGGASLVISGGF